MALMLKPDPELVHLDKVGQDKVDRILEIAFGTLALGGWQIVSGLTAEVVAEEETTDRVLNTSAHLHHVLHNLFDGSILNAHVDGSDGDHEVQTRDNVAGILNKLVEVGEVVGRMGFAQVDGKMAQGIEDGHVQLVVLFGAEAGGA
jgi:hypothetical protein